jgi:YD repeat-containing protein
MGTGMAVSRRRVLAQLFAGSALGASFAATGARAGAVSYKYDDAGRLIEATYPNGTILTYRYDPAGNRRQVFQGAAPTDFAAQIRVTRASNLRDLADAADYKGTDATITFVVNRDTLIVGDSGAAGAPGGDGGNGAPAIDTGTWPPGKTLSLELVIMPGASVIGGGGAGGGGAGGDNTPGGGSGAGGGDGTPGAGGAGGIGIYCRVPITIIVWPGALVSGGGVGGVGGEGVSERLFPNYFDDGYWNGGGGGGGYPNGLGGAGGVGIPYPSYTYVDNRPGDPGADGTLTGGGAGGAGGVGGGFYGQGYPGAPGGDTAAAYGIAKNGNVVSVVKRGTTNGGVAP